MATKTADYRFTVEGSGEFPLDMLRYDRCFPRSEEDANVAQYGHGRRRVTLVAVARPARYWQPTAGRWDSFNWHLVPGTFVETP